MIVLSAVLMAAASLGEQPLTPHPTQYRAFLELLQDQAAREAYPPPAPLQRGLVPISESNLRYTNTFINAVAAIALTSSGAPNRARAILDVLVRQNDACPGCKCVGGLQKERLITGEPDPAAERNDFFVGENAWLLAAVRYYHRQTGDIRYAAFVERIEGWLACLATLPPDPGLPAGYEKDGTLLPAHAEGSIDVIGSLNGSSRLELQADVKAWLDGEVWVPGSGSCFERGPDNRLNLPLDHVSWGVLALSPEYGCLLRHAEALNERGADRHVIELFDHEPLQYWISPPTGAQVAVTTRVHGQGRDLAVTYQMAAHNFLLLERDREVDFVAGPGFSFGFELQGDGSGRLFDVKLRNRGTNEVYWYQFPLDFNGWQRIQVPYEKFTLFGTPPPPVKPLGRVDKIQFGLGTGDQPAAGTFALGRIEYSSTRSPQRPSVVGFSSFQSERNWLFLEGTAAMATAYCVSGEGPAWARHLATLHTLARRARGNSHAWGLPSWFSGGWLRPEPNALGTAWILMAASCVDPF
jgi:hypothetical protein